jgi:hypothetical protein
LLKALDVEQKYWLIAEVATTNSHAQNPTVAQISLAGSLLHGGGVNLFKISSFDSYVFHSTQK